MRALRMLVFVLPIMGCCLFSQANIAAVGHKSNTIPLQWIGVILFVGSIIAIAQMTHPKPEDTKSLEAARREWDGPDSPGFLSVCETVGFSTRERAKFYEVAHKHVTWGQYSGLLQFAYIWRKNERSRSQMECQD